MNAKQEDPSNGAAFFCGLLTGVALGAGAAMLWAPKLGSEIRQDLTDGASDLGKAATETWRDVTTTATAAVQNGRETYERARSAVEEAAASASKAVDLLKGVVKDAGDYVAAVSESFPRPVGGGDRSSV